MQALKKAYRDALGARDSTVIDGAGRGKGGKQRKGQGKGAAGGCNNCGSMDHWIRDCDKAGPKPPDVLAAVGETAAGAKPPRQPNLLQGGAKPKDSNYGVDENFCSLQETITYNGSKVKRIPGTIDLNDFLASMKDNLADELEPCYRVKNMLDKTKFAGEAGDGIIGFVDQILLHMDEHKEYTPITRLCQMNATSFVKRRHHRPAGFAAQTRVHIGRLTVAALNDSGATCSCITEEQVVLIVNHTMRMLAEKKMKTTDKNYPIKGI